MINNLPTTSQDGQYGVNNCGTGTSQSSKCQTIRIKYGMPFSAMKIFVTNFQYNPQLCKRLLSLGTTYVSIFHDVFEDAKPQCLAYLSTIGDTERLNVAYCTKSGRGARTIPNGALKGVHFVKTPEYVQVTGVGDFTKINIAKGDAGGELDNRGADGTLAASFPLSCDDSD